MKSSKLFAFVVIAVLPVVAAHAARVDMTDPRRALGREDDIRVDAQLVDETVSSGAPVAVTYQVQNLSSQPIAVAGKVCDVSYHPDSRTITVSVGSEVPKGGEMPRVVTIAAGQTKTFTCGAILRVMTPATGSVFTSSPRFVQIKVNVLRDLVPFQALIQQQSQGGAPLALTDLQFDQWLESNNAILLNVIPVRFSASRKGSVTDASHHQPGSGSF